MFREKKKLVLFGIGHLTDVLFHYYQKLELANVVGFTVDKRYIKDNFYRGLPLVNFEELQQQ